MLLTFTVSPVAAASLHITVNAPDKVGKNLVYEIREKIATSARNKLVIDENDAAFGLKIVTIDPDDESNRTVYSLTLTMKQLAKDDSFDYYITSWVGVCGSSKTTSCASTLAADIDSEIQPIVEIFLKNLKKSNLEKGGKEPIF